MFGLKDGALWAERFDQTTDETQEAFASRVGGRLRGMSLPPENRVVQVDIFGEEREMDPGDWLIGSHQKKLMILNDEAFNKIFEYTGFSYNPETTYGRS